MAQGFRGAADGSSGGKPRAGNDYNKRLEEEMYERRRQGELRRQIEEKERELESMSHKNRDRLSR